MFCHNKDAILEGVSLVRLFNAASEFVGFGTLEQVQDEVSEYGACGDYSELVRKYTGLNHIPLR